jgi:hypothetical protein
MVLPPFCRRVTDSNQPHDPRTISNLTNLTNSSESASFNESTRQKRIGNSVIVDVEERKLWKQYMKAYEECLSANRLGIIVSSGFALRSPGYPLAETATNSIVKELFDAVLAHAFAIRQRIKLIFQ